MCCFSVWLVLSAQSVEDYPLLFCLVALSEELMLIRDSSTSPAFLHYIISLPGSGLSLSLPLMFYPCGSEFYREKVSSKTRRNLF